MAMRHTYEVQVIPQLNEDDFDRRRECFVRRRHLLLAWYSEMAEELLLGTTELSLDGVRVYAESAVNLRVGRVGNSIVGHFCVDASLNRDEYSELR